MTLSRPSQHVTAVGQSIGVVDCLATFSHSGAAISAREAPTYALNPVVRVGGLQRQPCAFLVLRVARMDLLPLITTRSAPVTRRSKMASAMVGLLPPR